MNERNIHIEIEERNDKYYLKINTIDCIENNTQNEEEEKEYLPIIIAFDMNEIIVCKEIANSIDFMKEWIEQPEMFKEYTIYYQDKEYNVIAELLFALIINEYTKKMEKQFILKETTFKLPEKYQSNTNFINRFKISLESIGLKGIEFDDPEFDYSNQAKILHTIIDNSSEYEKYKSIIQKKSTFQIDNSKPFTELEFNKIIP